MDHAASTMPCPVHAGPAGFGGWSRIRFRTTPCSESSGYAKDPRGSLQARPRGSLSSVMRRRATLPHPIECSTIAVPGLSFRVRNGTGRLPRAMTAANLLLYTTRKGPWDVMVREPDGGRLMQQ
jgi:hypothetical protein